MAVDVVDQLLDILEDEPLYVYHEIVHNRHVVERFRGRGVTFVERLDDVPSGSIVVFSAHGVSPALRQQADARQLTAIDATCPLVTKVHAEAVRYSRKGFQILLIGHADHQEVIGTRGEAPDAIQVVETVEDIDRLTIRDPNKVVYLTQTTLSMHDAQTIIDALKKAIPTIKDPPSDDICYATTNRQSAVLTLAPKVDLVLVVGSQNSSNSQRLRELAEAAGTTAHLIDDCSEIDDAWFDRVDSVLITAGASAPEDLVHEVIATLIDRYGGEVEQYDLFHERIEFGLPGSLKQFMRARDVNPEGRRISRDVIAETQAWLDDRDISNVVVDLTVSASGRTE